MLTSDVAERVSPEPTRAEDFGVLSRGLQDSMDVGGSEGDLDTFGQYFGDVNKTNETL